MLREPGVGAVVGGLIVPAVLLSVFVLLTKPLIVMGLAGMLGFRKRTGFLAGGGVLLGGGALLLLGGLTYRLVAGAAASVPTSPIPGDGSSGPRSTEGLGLMITGGVSIAAGIPMVVVGARRRRAHRNWWYRTLRQLSLSPTATFDVRSVGVGMKGRF